MFALDWPHIDHEWRNSKRAILAYHVGGWREGESPLDALARALGVSAQKIRLESTDSASAANELEQLSACLGGGWGEFPGLNIAEVVALAISALNEKLRVVPPEVCAFFGAPQQLEPFPQGRSSEGVARARREGLPIVLDL
jgi:hypothetical protein